MPSVAGRPDMRIAYFADTERLGGAERFLADVAGGAQAAGHETVVLSPQGFLLDFVRGNSPGSEVAHVALPDLMRAKSPASTISTLVRAVPRLRRALRGTRATLLHVNNGGYPGSDLCRLATLTAPLARIPVRLLSVHSAPRTRDESQPQLQDVVDRMVWRSVDAVHATTAFVEAGLHELRGMPVDRCTNIPYGVAEPTPAAQEYSELRARLAGGARLLAGMVSASADREKGHAVFLDAVAEAGEHVGAVVVGPYPGDSLPRQITRLELGDRVVVTGPVSPADVGQYLRAMDVLVVPSTAYESLPLVILEAMAAGKAVFASRLSGIPEAVVDGVTGRLFSPGSVGELAALLREAARNPEPLAEMGSAGHERWREKYTSGEMVTAVLALYEELAARRVTSRKEGGR
jgi:glycosyltransferase involved in cell wall biosynthesis